MGIGALALVLIIAVTVGVFALNSKKDKAPKGTEVYQYVSDQINNIETEYLVDGYVPDDKVDEAIKKVYKYVQKQGNVTYCEMNDGCVYMELDDGTGLVYIPEQKDALASGSGSTIATFQPYDKEFSKYTTEYSDRVDDAAKNIVKKTVHIVLTGILITKM